ncbi:hypothetical protein B0H11DRAFT_1956078, partial [Mycena galericulata]
MSLSYISSVCVLCADACPSPDMFWTDSECRQGPLVIASSPILSVDPIAFRNASALNIIYPLRDTCRATFIRRI